ncbi:MAG: hypothetical protein SNH05_08270, partial [Rikenellaceae bacterium]
YAPFRALYAIFKFSSTYQRSLKWSKTYVLQWSSKIKIREKIELPINFTPHYFGSNKFDQSSEG